MEAWEKPQVINTDNVPTYVIAISELKAEGQMPGGNSASAGQYLNNVVEAIMAS